MRASACIRIVVVSVVHSLPPWVSRRLRSRYERLAVSFPSATTTSLLVRHPRTTLPEAPPLACSRGCRLAPSVSVPQCRGHHCNPAAPLHSVRGLPHGKRPWGSSKHTTQHHWWLPASRNKEWRQSAFRKLEPQPLSVAPAPGRATAAAPRKGSHRTSHLVLAWRSIAADVLTHSPSSSSPREILAPRAHTREQPRRAWGGGWRRGAEFTGCGSGHGTASRRPCSDCGWEA